MKPYFGLWRGRVRFVLGRGRRLPVEVEDLVTDVLEVAGVEVVDKLVPPVVVAVFPVGPRLDLKLGQFDGQMHDGDGDYFRLPPQAQRGPEAVVDKGPRHLDHLLKLLRLAQAQGVLHDRAVRVVHSQVEFDRLCQIRNDMFVERFKDNGDM